MAKKQQNFRDFSSQDYKYMDLTLNAFNAFFEGQRFFESVTPEIRIEYPDGETEYDIDYIGEAEKKVRDYNDEAFELLNSEILEEDDYDDSQLQELSENDKAHIDIYVWVIEDNEDSEWGRGSTVAEACNDLLKVSGINTTVEQLAKSRKKKALTKQWLNRFTESISDFFYRLPVWDTYTEDAGVRISGRFANKGEAVRIYVFDKGVSLEVRCCIMTPEYTESTVNIKANTFGIDKVLEEFRKLDDHRLREAIVIYQDGDERIGDYHFDFMKKVQQKGRIAEDQIRYKRPDTVAFLCGYYKNGEGFLELRELNQQLAEDYVRDFENENITYFIYYIDSKNEWFKGWDF